MVEMLILRSSVEINKSLRRARLFFLKEKVQLGNVLIPERMQEL